MKKLFFILLALVLIVSCTFEEETGIAYLKTFDVQIDSRVVGEDCKFPKKVADLNVFWNGEWQKMHCPVSLAEYCNESFYNISVRNGRVTRAQELSNIVVGTFSPKNNVFVDNTMAYGSCIISFFKGDTDYQVFVPAQARVYTDNGAYDLLANSADEKNYFTQILLDEDGNAAEIYMTLLYDNYYPTIAVTSGSGIKVWLGSETGGWQVLQKGPGFKVHTATAGEVSTKFNESCGYVIKIVDNKIVEMWQAASVNSMGGLFTGFLERSYVVTSAVVDEQGCVISYEGTASGAVTVPNGVELVGTTSGVIDFSELAAGDRISVINVNDGSLYELETKAPAVVFVIE